MTGGERAKSAFTNLSWIAILNGTGRVSESQTTVTYSFPYAEKASISCGSATGDTRCPESSCQLSRWNHSAWSTVFPRGAGNLGVFDVYEATGLELFCGDFFVLTPAVLRPPAAIYDRAALISWVPELRAAYVDHLTALTKPGTQILLVTIEYPQPQMAGPPFSVNSDDVQALFFAKLHDSRAYARERSGART